MWKTEAEKRQGLSTDVPGMNRAAGSRTQAPPLWAQGFLHLMLFGVSQGPSRHREGLSVGRAEVCAVPLEAAGGGLAAAATRTGMGQKVVVTPVLELARGLAPGSAFRVRELATLPLLLPQPANKHSTDPVSDAEGGCPGTEGNQGDQGDVLEQNAVSGHPQARSTPASGGSDELLNHQSLGYFICKMEIIIPTSWLLVKSTGDHVYTFQVHTVGRGWASHIIHAYVSSECPLVDQPSCPGAEEVLASKTVSVSVLIKFTTWRGDGYWSNYLTKIVIGDWNVKVGSQEIPGVTGKFGPGIQNEARQRLTEFCQENALVIANTLFQQHKRRLYTWTSPGGQYRNQIDYILCGQRWRSSTQSAKTRPGVDHGSDHELLIAKFRLKLKKVGTTQVWPKSNPLQLYSGSGK